MLREHNSAASVISRTINDGFVVDRTRLAGLLLVLSGLFTFAAAFIPSHADFAADDDAAAIAAFFRDDEALQSLQAWLHPFGTALLLGALLSIYPRLHAAKHADGAGQSNPANSAHRGLAPLALIAAAALFTVTVVGFVVTIGAIRSSNEGFDPHLALFAYNLGWSLMVFTGAFLAPFLMIPFGILARPAGFPKWFASTSVVLGAVVAATALASMTPAGQQAGFIGFVLFLLWTLVAGVSLTIAGRRSAPHLTAS